MVGLQSLDLPIGVRIPVSQPIFRLYDIFKFVKPFIFVKICQKALKLNSPELYNLISLI